MAAIVLIDRQRWGEFFSPPYRNRSQCARGTIMRRPASSAQCEWCGLGPVTLNLEPCEAVPLKIAKICLQRYLCDMSTPDRQIEPNGLKALAHPLRVRILGVLDDVGEATASSLGAALGESSGSMSYHLRQLEKHGFVEDIPGKGSARERWWRAPIDGWTIGPDAFAATSPRAVDIVNAEFIGKLADRMARSLAEVATDHSAWRRSKMWRSSFTELTVEEMRAFIDEANAVVNKYAHRPVHRGSKRVSIDVIAAPIAGQDGERE